MSRLLAVATVAAALAGCTEADKSYIPASYTPVLVRAAPADALASTKEGWYLRCAKDRKRCTVERDVNHIGRYRENTVRGTLSYSVPGDRFALVLRAQPSRVRIQIDDNEPMAMRCPGRICTIATQPLLTQMQYGLVLRLDIKGPAGSYPERQSFALYGAFNEMRDAALREIGSR
jgi:hypothetical protein